MRQIQHISTSGSMKTLGGRSKVAMLFHGFCIGVCFVGVLASVSDRDPMLIVMQLGLLTICVYCAIAHSKDW